MKTIFKPIALAIFCQLTNAAYAQNSTVASTDFVSDDNARSSYRLAGSWSQGNELRNNVVLNWTVEATENVSRFDVERSFDGKDFTTAGLVFGGEKTGKEDFMFYETMTKQDKIFYRLKTYDKSDVISYSKVLVFQTDANKNNVKVLNNPVTDKLSLSFRSADTYPVLMKIADMNGRVQLTTTLSSCEGSNVVTIPTTSELNAGLYVIELVKGRERSISKFVKQ